MMPPTPSYRKSENVGNDVYLGEAVYHGESYPGKHKAIIAQELWDRVHNLIAEHRRDRSTLPRGQTPFPLKGLVRCGHCDMSMKPTHSRKKGQVQYRYYLCINAARAGHDQCQLPSMPAAELERLVLDHVRGLLQTPEVIAKALNQVRQNGSNRSDLTIIKQLTSLDPVWEELFPLEQSRLLKLLVESLVITTTGVDLRLRVAGLGALVDELVNEEERNQT